MTLKAAFIFIAPEADPAQHTAVVKPRKSKSPARRRQLCRGRASRQDLVAAGIVAIELCGGFGAEGVARVKKSGRGPSSRRRRAL